MRNAHHLPLQSSKKILFGSTQSVISSPTLALSTSTEPITSIIFNEKDSIGLNREDIDEKMQDEKEKGAFITTNFNRRKVKGKDTGVGEQGSEGRCIKPLESSSSHERREELNSPSFEGGGRENYFDALSSQSTSLPVTPSSNTSTTPSDSNFSTPNHSDYFSRPFRNVGSSPPRTSRPLPSIPSSPVPLPSSPYSTTLTPLLTTFSSQSSSPERTYFVESPTATNLTSTFEISSPCFTPSSSYSISSESKERILEEGSVDKGKERAKSGDRSERRYHALMELIETETSYLEVLKLLVQVYFQTLPLLSSLSRTNVELIYRNSRKLFELHERIVTRLNLVESELRSMRLDSNSHTHDCTLSDSPSKKKKGLSSSKKEKEMEKLCGMVARIYLDEIPNFQLYDDFCARHEEALNLIRSLESTTEWLNYTQLCSDLIASSNSTSTLTPSLPSSISFSTPTTPTTPTFPSMNSKSFPTTSSSTPTPTSKPSNDRPSSSHAITSSPSSPLLPTSRSNTSLTQFTNTSTSSRSQSHSKLRLQDYLIQPIQRICRYPLLFEGILKNLRQEVVNGNGDGDGEQECEEREGVKLAYEGFCEIARKADEAKTRREVEVRTKIVSLRMEFQSPVNSSFREVLGPVLLIHALNVVHRQITNEPTKIKYFGVFLYQTHLVLVKVKKKEVYEPREWLPLRLFEVNDIEDGEGILPYSFRLSYRDHHFEFGASCLVEKEIWLRKILSAKTQTGNKWDSQPLDKYGKPTMFDETVVSSITPVPASNILPGSSSSNNSTSRTTKTHIRSKSVGSIVAVSLIKPPTSPLEFSPIETTSPVLGSISLSSRNRFSTTASSLLGKTPVSARSAIDMRLSDVSSTECVTARAQAVRDENNRHSSSMSRPNSSKGRNNKSILRRLSLAEGTKFVVEGSTGFESGLMLDMGGSDRGEDWSSTLKRSSTSGRESLEIDTNVGSSSLNLNRSRSTSSWRTRTLSLRAQSQSHSRDGSISRGGKAGTDFGEVERNNSTSSQSTNSSFGTGKSSILTQATSFDSPSSSLPSSPTFLPVELPQGDYLTTSSSSRRNSMKSSSSQPSSNHSTPTSSYYPDENLSTTKLSRRSSTIGNFFSKRVQSSPSLSNLFNPPPPPSSPPTSPEFLSKHYTTYKEHTDLPPLPQLLSPNPTNASESSRNLLKNSTTLASSSTSMKATATTATKSKFSITTTSKPTRSKSIRFFFSANKFTAIN